MARISMKIRVTLLSLVSLLLVGVACASAPIDRQSNSPAPTLPRRAGARDESYPGVDVAYNAILDRGGHKLRLIVTRPRAGKRPMPAVFLVGWLSCDSVEAPPGSRSPLAVLFGAIARAPGVMFVRLEKPGQGDSEGNCAETDFATELDAYQRAFRVLLHDDIVDPARVFILGLSNGGGIAPLVAEGAPVRGYVIEGAWVKTWFEHMLEIERRRLALSGKSPADVNASMPLVADFYARYLIDGGTPAALVKRLPNAASLWDDTDFEHQYGRPITFYQQLQKLNLAEAWSRVRSPVLVLHGQYDWIMSASDHDLIAGIVNSNVAGSARSLELKNTGHAFDSFRSMNDAFIGAGGPIDPAIPQLIVRWIEEHL